MRWSLRGTPCLILSLVVSIPAWARAQAAPDSVAGRYSFAATAENGVPLTGTIHLLPAGNGWSGRVLTDLRPPLAIESVTVDSFITVRTRVVGLRWRLEGDSLTGHWRVGNETGVIHGRRLGRLPGDDLPLTPCRVGGLDEVVQCATRFVAEVPGDARSRRIPLNLVVLPATGARDGHAAVHVFAGGPGQAATRGAAGYARRFAGLRTHKDIVVMDQRGTGESNGLYCRFESAEEGSAVLFGGFFPVAASERCRDQLVARADLRHYHTAAAAGDVEEVRQWLGYERLDLYGGSYGTRAALAYLRLHPERVRTVVLRGTMAPDASLVFDAPLAAQEVLDRIVAECAAEAPCRAAYPDLASDVRSAFDRAGTAPATVRVRAGGERDSLDVVVTRGVLGGAVRRMLMDAEAQRAVPSALHRAGAGDFSPFRQGIERTLAMAGDLAWGMGLSVTCAEDPRILAQRDTAGATAGSYMGSAAVEGMARACAVWPAGSPPSGFDRPVVSDVPVLLLSGGLDPATPAAWASEVAASLRNGRHVVMPGLSHGEWPACARELAAAFIEAGSAAGLDASCADELQRQPFIVEPATGR